jgi:surface antigen
VALVPAAANAADNVLPNAPIASMTDVDLAIARAAIRAGLEEAPDGERRRWTNPGSGASGTVTPTRSFERDGGQTCRSVDLTFKAGGQTATDGRNFCRAGEGWKVVGGR